MKIILATSDHEMSKAIRSITSSQYSHIAIVDGGSVIEAKPRVGVVVTPLATFKRNYPIHELRELPGDIDKAKTLIGRPYDYEGMLGLGYHIWTIQDPQAYFCSELIGIAADDVLDIHAHRTLPDHYIHLSELA